MSAGINELAAAPSPALYNQDRWLPIGMDVRSAFLALYHDVASSGDVFRIRFSKSTNPGKRCHPASRSRHSKAWG
jgi:hypothetical protein